ncbi:MULTISPECIES: hypothetical protein [unclassified Brevundimonas]|uniref:hypothetical protein n=1 Tax=unclassified Brevundimonas TaxID=2622653 RepID=UPI0012E3CA25|nr:MULTISPECIES: hypothetical protein [unclassified Brevundimonas]
MALSIGLVVWRTMVPPSLLLTADGLADPGRRKIFPWREMSPARLVRPAWWLFMPMIRFERLEGGKNRAVYVPDIYGPALAEVMRDLEASRIRGVAHERQ